MIEYFDIPKLEPNHRIISANTTVDLNNPIGYSIENLMSICNKSRCDGCAFRYENEAGKNSCNLNYPADWDLKAIKDFINSKL